LYDVPAQRLNRVRWTTGVDLHYTGNAHYGAPLITPANTVLVPVKTASGFQVSAFEGATGRLKYTLTNDYIMAPIAGGGWVPVYQPVLATGAAGTRLYYAGPGGTTYYVDNIDSDIPGTPVHQCFYTDLTNYLAKAAGTNGFNNTVFINTPLTADTNGVVFFGFRVQRTAPAPLNTTNGGFVRLSADGTGTYVLAGPASGDTRISRDSHNCAPALSRDGETLYVAVKGTNAAYCYLLGLDSATLATKFRTFLQDPRNGLPALVSDDGTASPMVGPDGDVFFGVLSNPGNGSRGFLLHFSGDLQTRKPPSGFGWDYTAAVVPAGMVPSYTGPSSYLLFSKYNNYAGSGGDGDGINRLALLDPNATQLDPHPTANHLVEMREVMTVIGCTPDVEFQGTNYPYAVREWCINTAAVNPASRSVFAPSEDGHIYRWDLAANSLSEAFGLTGGVGEPYVPTVIAPDGTIYTMSGETLFALGGLTNVSIQVFSSAPDLRTVVAGQSVTFTAMVTNLDASGPAPTGNVTFEDRTYSGLTAVTNILAAALPLTNSVAILTTSTLSADTNYLGSHYITAYYSGDGTFPAGSATLVQKVHAHATSTLVATAATGSNNSVVVTATIVADQAGSGTPTGMVAFWDGTSFLAQLPLNKSGVATLTLTSFLPGSHNLNASYASDTLFASSTGFPPVTQPELSGTLMPANGAFELSFTNTVGAPFTILGSADLTVPLSEWTALGSAIEVAPGQFQFTDSQVSGELRFYCVRSP
jgi:uncharacterized repeat protein (TIGR01451 family)